MITITVVVDNEPNPDRSDLIAGWGLSLYVKYRDVSILFDLGHDEFVFRHNVERLGLNLRDVKYVIISHEHGDHTGGLGAIVELGSNITVYFPEPSLLASRLTGLVNVHVVGRLSSIFENLYVLPFRDPIPEQVLVIDEPYGLIVLTGCSHPGIFRIVNTCIGIFRKKIRLLIGGLHTFALSGEKLEATVSRICRMRDIELLCPLHCSGPEIKKVLRDLCPDKLVYAAVGYSIEVSQTGAIHVREAT